MKFKPNTAHMKGTNSEFHAYHFISSARNKMEEHEICVQTTCVVSVQHKNSNLSHCN